TLVPDSAGAEHRVKLGLFPGGYRRIIKGQFDTHAVQRLLRYAVHGYRRGDVADVHVVVTHFPVRGNAVGPGDDRGVGDTPLVRGVALEQLIRRVERHRPSDRIVVVGLRSAEVVHEPQAFFHGVDVAVEEFDLVHRPVRAALSAGADVGDDHDDGVV